MSDQRNILQAKYGASHRFLNFGHMLIQIHVNGFRCHSNTVIEINSPITALCGYNGTGKSTILQLASTAYTSPNSRFPQYYVKDFMVVGTLDPTPFTDDASVEFRFWNSDRSVKRLKFSRDAKNKKWIGYRSRKIAKPVFFASIGLYLPKVERRDFTVRNASRVTVTESSKVAEIIKDWSCKVLGHSYENIYSHILSLSNSSKKVIAVHRTGINYSEPHMGFGEARSQYLINVLEALPDKSLVLIEEPETSLHPSAQYQFGRYLVDVAIRKCHQIILTTHSEFVLEALPSASRIYLNRGSSGIEPIPGLTSQQAKSLMAGGHVKALHVLVEDNCAKAILSEIIRRIDSNFLRSVGIHPVGDADTIAKTVRTLNATGLPVAAVRDGDQPDIPDENIFKLPGTLPPEKELFSSEPIKTYIRDTYNLNLDDFAAGILSGIDHHHWCERLANHLICSESGLLQEMARIYAISITENEASTIVALLKEPARA